MAAVGIFAAAWIVLGAIGSAGYSAIATRFKRRAQTFTHWTLWMPEVPTLDDDEPAWDETALNVWPADTPLAVMEQAVFDRWFEQMPLVADDLRRSA